jgi:endonuclease/exonuclease/phosphatase family metal-dependent hydrolase
VEVTSTHHNSGGAFWRGARSVGACLILLTLAIVLALPPIARTQETGAFRVATFNIGYIRDPEGLPKWEARRNAVTGVMKAMEADIVAFQEMETFAGGKFNRINRQLDWVLQTVPGYKAAAVGDPRKYPSTQPILYRPAKFDFVEQGFFYFSTTPDVIFSRSFDGGFDHYATTARFREKATGKTVTLINVHTDMRSAGNRRGATGLIVERTKALMETGERVIVLGDFNALRSEGGIRRLVNSGLEGTDLFRATFHFALGIGLWPAIDHILHGPGIERVGQASIHRDRFDGVYPSDHYPVSADYRFVEN